MANLRFTDGQAHPTECLDFTSLPLPARSLTALAHRLGLSEADVASVIAPLEEESLPLATAPASPSCP
jgi:hypothetical protein